MNLAELPEWVWQVIEATQQYEEEHPMLLRETTDGVYERTRCLDGILYDLIQHEVQQAAKVMRARRGVAT